MPNIFFKNHGPIKVSDIIKNLNLNGIGTSVHYLPVHMHSYYVKKYDYDPNDFPKANNLSKNVISLPIYPSLSTDELNYIIDSISKLWKKYKI
jgi:dTDP-4-amino-4,6-dideoxygalactose transaminase